MYRTLGTVSALLITLALSGCEVVNRYVNARQSMKSAAAALASETQLPDAYTIVRAAHSFKQYGDAIAEASSDAGTIARDLDRAPREDQLKLRQIFNPQDRDALDAEISGVQGFVDRLRHACAAGTGSSQAEAACVSSEREALRMQESEAMLKAAYALILNKI